jgi:hypothetical protein
MACTGFSHSLSSSEVLALERAILNLFPEPTPVVFNRILQLIAGQPLLSMKPSFVIRQPKVLRLLVATFSTSPMLVDTLAFVAKLCQFSPRNCDEAHTGEFDLYLVSLLATWRNDFTCPLPTVASALSLFTLIASNTCSATVVQSFISLLCPVGGKVFPVYAKLIMKTLTSLLECARQNPVSVLPLMSGCDFHFRNFACDLVSRGITITTWVKAGVPEVNYHPQVLVLYDARRSAVCLSVIGDTAHIVVRSGSHDWAARIEGSLTSNEWTFIAVTIATDAEDGRIHVEGFLNADYPKSLILPNVCFTSGMLSGSIGGLLRDSVVVNDPLLVSSIGIFDPLVRGTDANPRFGSGGIISSRLLATLLFGSPRTERPGPTHQYRVESKCRG